VERQPPTQPPEEEPPGPPPEEEGVWCYVNDILVGGATFLVCFNTQSECEAAQAADPFAARVHRAPRISSRLCTRPRVSEGSLCCVAANYELGSLPIPKCER
jgi:hypothetical protein